MDTLPILVPALAVALCIPASLFCGCYRNLNARISALEGRLAAAAAAAPSPTSTGYVGGVTYAAAPPPSAPPASYPIYVSPPLQPQTQLYWTPQKGQQGQQRPQMV